MMGFEFPIGVEGDFSGAASDFAEVTALDLAVACGCSGITPSPSTLIGPVDTLAPFTPSPVTITSAPFSVVGSPMPSSTAMVTCDGEFSVTSNVAPVLEGCFQNTASETTSTFNGQEVYGIVPDGQGSATTLIYAFVVDTAFDSLVSIGVRGAIYFEHTLAPRCKSFGQRVRFVFPCLDRCRAVVIYF